MSIGDPNMRPHDEAVEIGRGGDMGANRQRSNLADFYRAAFGWQEVRRLDNPRCRGVVLSDGAINISVLNFKQDQIGRGMEFTGLHHLGVYVDDMDDAEQSCLAGRRPYDELPEDKNERTTGRSGPTSSRVPRAFCSTSTTSRGSRRAAERPPSRRTSRGSTGSRSTSNIFAERQVSMYRPAAGAA